MSVAELLHVFRVRWKVVAASLLLCLLAAGGLTARETPLYASSTQLFVSAASDQDQQIYQGSLYSVQRVKSYQRLVGSLDVARDVVGYLDLSLSAEELRAKASAVVMPDTTVLQLTVSDPDPKVAQSLARGYAEVLVTVIDDLETPTGEARPLVKVEVVDSAGLPASPYSPNWFVRIFIGLFAGLVLGLSLAVVRHLLDNRIRDPQEASDLISAPLLGVLARFDTEEGRALSGSPIPEAFRLLRTNLAFADAGRAHGVYVVASPVPGDGKTTIALELGKSLALTGRNVLVIDGDLRKATLGARTKLERQVGLTTVLIGAIDFREALQATGVEGLTVLTSGKLPPNPAELVQTTAMAKLLEEARHSFDITLVDAAPLLPVTDTAVLATLTDGVLMVVRHGVTTRHQLELANGRLESVQANLLGLVVNMAPATRRGGYDYGYVDSYGQFGQS